MSKPKPQRSRGDDICPADGQPIEERHLVAGVRFMAHVVDKYGVVYAPIFERFERELAEFRRRGDVSARARRMVEESAE